MNITSKIYKTKLCLQITYKELKPKKEDGANAVLTGLQITYKELKLKEIM